MPRRPVKPEAEAEPCPPPLPDPAATHPTPEALAADSALPLAERIRLLECWQVDSEALQRADDEGMQGGEQPRLSRVQKLLAVLKDKLERGES
jgi:hypothetical protein